MHLWRCTKSHKRTYSILLRGQAKVGFLASRISFKSAENTRSACQARRSTEKFRARVLPPHIASLHRRSHQSIRGDFLIFPSTLASALIGGGPEQFLELPRFRAILVSAQIFQLLTNACQSRDDTYFLLSTYTFLVISASFLTIIETRIRTSLSYSLMEIKF